MVCGWAGIRGGENCVSGECESIPPSIVSSILVLNIGLYNGENRETTVISSMGRRGRELYASPDVFGLAVSPVCRGSSPDNWFGP